MADRYDLTPPPRSWWRRGAAALPMRLALLAVAVVWLLGCAWSFEEQTAFATSKRFALPELLPLVIDGFAVAMAGVAWAASLDARPAVAARAATLVAVAGSAASNGTWAWIRSQHDVATIALAMAVPIAANVAFEVLLAELRRQVQRRRGLAAPVAVPYPRLLRTALAPWRTLREWRALVLELTALPAPARGILASESPMPLLGRPVPRPEIAAQVAASLELPDQTPRVAAAATEPDPDPAQPPPTPIRGSSPDVPDGRSRPVPGHSASARPLIGDRRLDERAIALAARLAALDDPDAVTGGNVGDLLGIELAPRTGRRLLGQARALRRPDGADHAPLPTDEFLTSPRTG